MRCIQCHNENDNTHRFCSQCGAALQIECNDCGFTNRSEANFCGGCGVSLQLRLADKQTAANSTHTPYQQLTSNKLAHNKQGSESVAERRQLTLMFCDLVGSTEISSQLDPEDLRELIRSYQQTATRTIHRYEGVIARYMGDGILAYFGYPLAHENDAERAVRSGLEIVSAIRKLDEQLGKKFAVKLAVRIGIATGPVVIGDLIGDGSAEECAVVGKTPNLASRIESVAAANSVYVAPQTYQLISNLFKFKNMGQFSLKGIAEPVDAWRVISAKTAQNRFNSSNDSGLSSFVSRVDEIELMMSCWQKAVSGQGGIIQLEAEAGFGKSRLLQVLKDRIQDQFHHQWECQCSTFYKNSAFYPIIDFMQHLLEFKANDSAQQKLQQLESFLQHLNLPLAEYIPVLAPLFSIPLDDPDSSSNQTSSIRKQKILDVLSNIIISMTNELPLLFVIEDLHWVDPSTLELLEQILPRANSEKLLILLTYRPEFESNWVDVSGLNTLTLQRLGSAEAELLVVNVAEPDIVSGHLRKKIVERADGIPLFIEELTRFVLQTGHKNIENSFYSDSPDIDIPETLRDSLMARLDTLGEVKELAQLSSVIGRTFSFDQLSKVSSMDSEQLQQKMQRMCESGLVLQQGKHPYQIFTFKHALIQDTAYDSLLRSKRREYHGLIAQRFEQCFPELSIEQPEILAHHFSLAMQFQSAINYWHRAALNAIKQSANHEAIDHLNQGLALLAELPESPQRLQQELDFQVALGPPLIGARSYAAPEVEQAFTRALQLCKSLDDKNRLFRVLSGLSSYHLIHANPLRARKYQQQCVDIAMNEDSDSLKVQSYSWQGTILFYLGEFEAAQQYFHHTLDLYDAKRHAHLGFEYGLDPAILSHVHLTWLFWLQGDPKKALQQQKLVNDYSAELKHPLSTIHALNFEVVHYFFRGESDIALSKAENLLSVAKRHQFSHYIAYATIMRGSVLAEQGQYDQAIQEIEKGIDIRQQTGAALALPLFKGQLAYAYARHGQVTRGLEMIERSKSVIEQTSESWWQAEIYRLEGEILLIQADSSDSDCLQRQQAEQCFRQSIMLSRKQGLSALESRAKTSLASCEKLTANG